MCKPRLQDPFPPKLIWNSLHDKMWLAHIDREVKEVWRQKLGRMEGYWLAMGGGPEAWNSTSLTYM